jgi:hypothetical protein
MNKPIRRPSSPQLTQPSQQQKSFQDLRSEVVSISKDIRSVLQYTDQLFTEIIALINSSTQGVGEDIASAATISPVWPIHRVTGTAAIDTINPPAGFSGPLWLIPTDLWTTVTGGNIALGTTAVVNRVLILVYENINSELWYPSY